MLLIALFFPLLLWAAQPVTHCSRLDALDQLRDDKGALVDLYQKEAIELKNIFVAEMGYLTENSLELIRDINQMIGATHQTNSIMTMIALSGDLFLAIEFMDANCKFMATGKPEKALRFVDLIFQAIIKHHSFWLSRDIIVGGDKKSFSLQSVFGMSERHTNICAWVRIAFSLMDLFPPADPSAQVGGKFLVRSEAGKLKVDSRTKDVLLRRISLTEDWLVRLLRLQYLGGLMAGKVVLPSASAYLAMASTIAAHWAWSYPNQLHLSKWDQKSLDFAGLKIALPMAHRMMISIVKITPVTCLRTSDAEFAAKSALGDAALVRVNMVANLYNFLVAEVEFVGDWTAIRVLCEFKETLISQFPASAARLEKLCEPKEVKPKRKNAKKKKNKADAGSAQAQATKIPQQNSTAELPLDCDSDEEDDSVTELTELVGSLSFEANPVEWRASEAWLLMAKVHLAQYCRVSKLIPLRNQKYPNGIPDTFTWSMLLENDTSDPDLVFCIKVTSDRNLSIKGDYILGLVPPIDFAHETLSKRLTFDYKTLELLYSFIPGQRKLETSPIVSTLLPEVTVNSGLLILIMDRACKRLASTDLHISASKDLCKQIHAWRRFVAHPSVSPRMFELLKTELTKWHPY